MADTNNSRECLFCRIRDKQLVGHIIFEDDHAFAILDIQPRAPGHAMVIPKYHSPTVLGLPDEEIGPLFAAVKRVSGLLMQSLKPDGLTIGINQGRVSGQIVDHLHVHVMPRFLNDRGGAVQSVVNNPEGGPLDMMVRKIKSTENT